MKLLNNYQRRWILHCAWGELLGIGAAGMIAFGVNQVIGEPVTLLQKITVLITMLGAGALEGGLLGWFQWQVLKDRIPILPAREWVGLTVAVAVLGWFLGMLPSLFFLNPGPTNTTAAAPSFLQNPWVLIIITIAMGLLVGALFGLFQWFALRKYVMGAGSWITANALGWGLGLGWIYLAASWPDENTSLPIIIISGIAGGILAGLTVGFITGLYLPALTQNQPSAFGQPDNLKLTAPS